MWNASDAARREARQIQRQRFARHQVNREWQSELNASSTRRSYGPSARATERQRARRRCTTRQRSPQSSMNVK